MTDVDMGSWIYVYDNNGNSHQPDRRQEPDDHNGLTDAIEPPDQQEIIRPVPVIDQHSFTLAAAPPTVITAKACAPALPMPFSDSAHPIYLK